MKKFVTLAIIASIVISLNAQDATTVVLLNYNTVKKKVEKSDAEIQDPKKNAKASTWEKRGELYQDVFMLGLEQLQEGMDATTVQLFYKEPNNITTETIEGALHETYVYDHMTYTFVNGALQDWKKTDPIHENPLRVATDAYVKALELDTKGKSTDKIKENLTELKNQLKRDGVNHYYAASYDDALSSFENVLEIKNLVKVFPGVRAVDDVSFTVKRGEILGLVGESGSGKSVNLMVFLSVIASIFKPYNILLT